MERIILIGNGGHAKSIVDSIEGMGKYEIAGFIAEKQDDNFEYRGYKIVGIDDDLESLYQSGIKCAAVGVGYMGKGNTRDNIYNKLKEIGYVLPAIIDATAVLAKDVNIEEGTYVGKNAVINAGAVVGKMAIINTAAIVEHDCVIGDFSHVAVNTTLCGAVLVGAHSFIGANATIIQEIEIGDNAVIGANSTILRKVYGNQTIYGIGGGISNLQFLCRAG